MIDDDCDDDDAPLLSSDDEVLVEVVVSPRVARDMDSARMRRALGAAVEVVSRHLGHAAQRAPGGGGASVTLRWRFSARALASMAAAGSK